MLYFKWNHLYWLFWVIQILCKKYRKIFGTIIQIANPLTQLRWRKFPKLSSGVLFCGSSQVCLLQGLLQVMSGAWLEQNTDNALLIWLPGKQWCPSTANSLSRRDRLRDEGRSVQRKSIAKQQESTCYIPNPDKEWTRWTWSFLCENYKRKLGGGRREEEERKESWGIKGFVLRVTQQGKNHSSTGRCWNNMDQTNTGEIRRRPNKTVIVIVIIFSLTCL